MSASGRPPALLAAADFYGTLAAARSLGRAGVPVVVADPHLLAPARWSRFAGRSVFCPAISDVDRFLPWLLEFGRRHPGHVLMPTSDELAWTYALHRDELAQSFRLLSPPIEAVWALLDKKRLCAAAERAGVPSPRTWFPESEADLPPIAASAPFPVLIKPRTQVQLASQAKGVAVLRPEEFVATYRRFRAANPHGTSLVAFDPGATWPLVQALHPEAATSIYSLSGFADPAAGLFEVRASRKVLQRPRRLGIGLCFEAAPVDSSVAEGVWSLCRAVGWHGVFEAELIETAGGPSLIDFNPRFFSQMALDVARGLPLPLIAYEMALGRRVQVAALVAQARAGRPDADAVWSHGFLLSVMLSAQRASGRMAKDQVRAWRRWAADHRGRATDAVADPGDRLPGVADAAQQVYGFVRHPRAFLRQLALDR